MHKDLYNKKENYSINTTKNDEDNNSIRIDEFIDKKDICSHIIDEDILDTIEENEVKYIFEILHKGKKMTYFGICLSCGKVYSGLDELNKHTKNESHKIFINIVNLAIICNECKSKYKLELMNNILKYRILYQFCHDYKIRLPEKVNLLNKEEIFEIKYNKFINDFKEENYKKILFMVGAGISTSAGIPDFRSKTGLFKQLQDKYNLSTPEEFFLLSTFLKKPNYFYEFTKLFDLSKVNPTISHKFMNYLISKNIVKYVFTQNIDGLEKKAKIPDEKLIFAHGNFYTGHCGKCKRSIDIKMINKGIELGEVYYCPKCKGPCKPNVVFYGENLPDRFYDKLDDCKDIDLIIIMGTSLKVQPFASIPIYTSKNTPIILFNMEEVGDYAYGKLTTKSIFIQGKTDENIIKFLNDTNLINDFSKFIKKEYNEDLNNIISIKNSTINVGEKEEKEDKNKIDKLTDDIKQLNLSK